MEWRVCYQLTTVLFEKYIETAPVIKPTLNKQDQSTLLKLSVNRCQMFTFQS